MRLVIDSQVMANAFLSDSSEEQIKCKLLLDELSKVLESIVLAKAKSENFSKKAEFEVELL